MDEPTENYLPTGPIRPAHSPAAAASTLPPDVPPLHLPGSYAEFRLGMLAEHVSLFVARHLVQSALLTWNLPALVDDARIIVNELATNAIDAAPEEWMEVVIELQPDGVTISVWDSCPDLPLAPQLVDLDDEGGRGLFVVAMLAAKHGTTRTPERCGKAVWALLLTDQEQEAA